MSTPPSPRERAQEEVLASSPRLVQRRQVGNYTIVASLGRGGAGEVFLALSTGLSGFQKLVVVKMLHSHFEEDPSIVAMFLDEARLAAKLSHPNIAQTLEVGVEGDRHFIAMTFLEGLPLHRILARFGQRGEVLPPEVAARIAIEVLDGLAYAHTATDFDGAPLNIVHRDVSPANVFVCWDGSVKLLDFGIAKAARRRANTDSGIIKGKFGYISPEQATGGAIDARADLWSVGVVLWEMLTARRLFPRLNDVATLQRLVTGPIAKVTDVAPDLPEPLAEIIDATLQREPDERWGDAPAMKEALEAWLSSLPRAVTRDDIAACIGDLFTGEREQQQDLIRMCVGAPKLAATPSGSFAVRDETSRRILVPKTEAPVRQPKAPLLLAALACVALGAIVGGSAVRSERSDANGSPERATRASQGVEPERPPDQEDEGNPAHAEERSGNHHTGNHHTGDHHTGDPNTDDPNTDDPNTGDPNTDDPNTDDPHAGEQHTGAGEQHTGAGEQHTGAGGEESPGGDPPSDERTARPATEHAGEAAPPPTEEVAAAPVLHGQLSLDTTPWSIVTLAGRNLGTTPLVRVSLAEGTHVLRLRNPERGLETTFRVRIRAGETTTRRVALE
ncbi:MAG: protein kinase [Myxococcota bacterium]